MNAGILKAEGLCKSYKDREVLHNLDLTIEPGKIYGLIGRNGAGKTTLLGILTAQNTKDGGTVTYDGQPVWENQNALNHICFSRELQPTLFSGPNNLKIRHYLKSAAIYYPNWDMDYAMRLLDEFKLETRKKISQLSKGQMSMVTILIALASRAPITILDEPAAGLDVVMRERFYQLLLEDFAQTGRTFIVSTHIIEEAANVLEDVIILHEGKDLIQGDTQAFVDSAVHVSGKIEEVDAAVTGLEVHHTETVGRSKGVTVFLKPGQRVDGSRDVSVQPVSLQRAFVALCGEEETRQ